MSTTKIIRVTTIPVSLAILLKGQLNYMNKYFDVLAVSSANDDFFSLEDYANSEKIAASPVELTRRITPLKDLIALYKLYVLFKKEKPHIVHSHTPKAGTTAMLAAKMAGIPHRLHTIAGLPLVEAKGLKRVLLTTIERFTYSCATSIYPNSKGLMNIILNEKLTKENKIKVIGNGSSNGIDTNYFDPGLYSKEAQLQFRKELGIAPDDFVFLFAGRMVKDKGINELVEAFIKVNQIHSKTKLLLIGRHDGNLDPLNKFTLEQLENHPSIIAAGWHKDVRPYFSISDTFTFPSYREGFPNVVLQAGAMGLYSIVSDINGCNEIIIDGENGRIVPVKNVSDLVIAMEEAVLTISPGSKANFDFRNLIQKNYSMSYLWQCLLSEYENLEGVKTIPQAKPKLEAHV